MLCTLNHQIWLCRWSALFYLENKIKLLSACGIAVSDFRLPLRKDQLDIGLMLLKVLARIQNPDLPLATDLGSGCQTSRGNGF